MALLTPIRWLQDFVSCPLTPEELAERLTISGMEVEGVAHIGQNWGDRCRVAEVVAVEKHPDADSLSLVTVKYGDEDSLQLVTGAPNIRALEAGLPEAPVKVALALTGAKLINPYKEGHPLTELKPSKIRGIRSEGMICSELELGIGESHEGVLLLPEEAPTGALLQDYLGDAVLDFDIKGGFAHLLSILGIARETAAILDVPLKREVLPEVSSLEVVAQPDYVGLEIADPDLCPRYSALLIRGVKVGPSPFWMQQRLLRCGMRPINNIVDITNYVMLELGQPLHAFDYQKLCERAGGRPTIIVRRAQPGETLTTLDDVERKLDENMLMITDTAGLIAIAGIMGGADTEVSEDSTDILIEAASFEFLNNRRTVQQLKLRTEAAERFGKQLDPDGTLPAALRAAELMAAHGGGTLEAVAGDLYPGRPEPVTLQLDPHYVQRLLGIDLPVEEMIRILRALEFTVTPGDVLQVKVPNHRQDVRIPADLVEEIVRIHGYTQMPATLIRDELPPQRPNPGVENAERIRNLLTGLGLDEIITYSMIDPHDEARLAQQEAPDLTQFVPLKNPLSQERTHLRRTLLPGALQTARSNLRFLDRVTLFEIGSVFHPQAGEVLPAEPRRLSILLTGVRQAAGWQEAEAGKLDFFDLKGLLEEFFQALHLTVQWEQAQEAPFHPGRCAALTVNGEPIGHAGELHPELRHAFELPEQPLALAHFDVAALMAQSVSGYQMQEISAFTPVFEDLAVVVDVDVPAASVEALLHEAGGALVREARLFDVYQGEQVPAGKKSLAYALTYQATDRTLSDKDVEKTRKRLIKRLEQTLGASLRA